MANDLLTLKTMTKEAVKAFVDRGTMEVLYGHRFVRPSMEMRIQTEMATAQARSRQAEYERLFREIPDMDPSYVFWNPEQDQYVYRPPRKKVVAPPKPASPPPEPASPPRESSWPPRRDLILD